MLTREFTSPRRTTVSAQRNETETKQFQNCRQFHGSSANRTRLPNETSMMNGELFRTPGDAKCVTEILGDKN